MHLLFFFKWVIWYSGVEGIDEGETVHTLETPHVCAKYQFIVIDSKIILQLETYEKGPALF